jgi:hypothetical protein
MSDFSEPHIPEPPTGPPKATITATVYTSFFRQSDASSEILGWLEESLPGIRGLRITDRTSDRIEVSSVGARWPDYVEGIHWVTIEGLL